MAIIISTKLLWDIVQMIDELQQGRVPIDQPQTGRLEYYQGKYHSTKKMLFTKVSAEQKAMQKIMTSMREQGMQIPEMLLKDELPPPEKPLDSGKPEDKYYEALKREEEMKKQEVEEKKKRAIEKRKATMARRKEQGEEEEKRFRAEQRQKKRTPRWQHSSRN